MTVRWTVRPEECPSRSERGTAIAVDEVKNLPPKNKYIKDTI